MRLFSWLLDCRASLAMTGRVQRRPLPVIARRSCAAAIQSFSVRRPEEAAFDQWFGHLFLFSGAKQSRRHEAKPGLLRRKKSRKRREVTASTPAKNKRARIFSESRRSLRANPRAHHMSCCELQSPCSQAVFDL